VPNGLPSNVYVIIPVGVPSGEVTEHGHETFWPSTLGFSELVMVVVVSAGTIASTVLPGVPTLLLLSPEYATAIV